MKGMRYYQIQLERPSLNWKPPSRLRVHSAYVPPTFRLRSAYVPPTFQLDALDPSSLRQACMKGPHRLSFMKSALAAVGIRSWRWRAPCLGKSAFCPTGSNCTSPYYKVALTPFFRSAHIMLSTGKLGPQDPAGPNWCQRTLF